MTAICASSILACGMRVTLLDNVGNVANQADNFYVTNSLVQLVMTPQVETGPEPVLRGGCGCIIASAKFPDLLKRFNFEVQLGQLEPGLVALMTGGTVIESGPDPIGFDWPDTGVSCSATPPPKVALEIWSYVWEGNQQNPTLPYWHWVWPLTQWQFGPATLNSADFFTPTLTGFSNGNGAWGHGPYNDDPGQVIGDLGSVWQTVTAPPDAECAFQTVTPSS